MSGKALSDGEGPAFDVSIEQAGATPVIEAEEDDDDKRAREAALASIFDQERAHAGKSEEEMIAEREQSAREAIDLAIAIGVVVAVTEANDEDAVDLSDDGGE